GCGRIGEGVEDECPVEGDRNAGGRGDGDSGRGGGGYHGPRRGLWGGRSHSELRHFGGGQQAFVLKNGGEGVDSPGRGGGDYGREIGGGDGPFRSEDASEGYGGVVGGLRVQTEGGVDEGDSETKEHISLSHEPLVCDWDHGLRARTLATR